MAISNIALYNELTSLTSQVRRLRQQLCCSNGGGEGLTQVYYDNTGNVTFSGTGTQDDPLIADITSTSVNTLYTANGTISTNRAVAINPGISLGFTGTPAGSTDLQKFGIDQSTGTSFSYIGTRTSTTKYSEFRSFSSSLITQIEATNNQPLGVHRFQIDPNQIVLIATNNTNSGFRAIHSNSGASWFANDGAAMFTLNASTKAVNLSAILNAPFLTTNGSGAIVTGTKAAHVDPSTGTVADIVNALIAAGLMA